MGNSAKSLARQQKRENAIRIRATQPSLLKHIKKEWKLYAFLLIPVIYYIIFKYLPMAGNIIAFRKYRAGGSIFGVEWSGLKYFRQFTKDPSFWRAFRNTLIICSFVFRQH